MPPIPTVKSIPAAVSSPKTPCRATFEDLEAKRVGIEPTWAPFRGRPVGGSRRGDPEEAGTVGFSAIRLH